MSANTSLAFNFLKGRDTASPHMRKVADESTRMAGRIRLSSIVSVAATAAMAVGWAALGAHAVAGVAAVAPLIGLLATVPAVSIAAAGGIATLIMGFSGLGAAMKKSAGGAGVSSQALVAAERRVESAQQTAIRAQQDLNDARDQAADRLIVLRRELAHNALDERAAALAVTDAQRQLREARSSGNRSDVTHAQLGYEQAVMSLEDVRLRTAELREEEQKRTHAGVEGSDEVLVALQRQADAMRDLADAQAALNTPAGGGGIDAAAEAYGKLSLAGRQLVDVLRLIGPQWRGVQQSVQQAVFAGVAGDVKVLSDTYLPIMSRQLPAIGQGWNNAFRGMAKVAATDKFVQNLNGTLGNTATFWQRVGNSFAPFLSGFNTLAEVGSRFLPGWGSNLERAANAFDRWATAAADTGRAQGWMSTALTVLSQVWQIATNLGGSIAAIFRAGDAGPGWLAGLVEGTQRMQDFLESPAGQGKIAEVFATLRDVGSQLWSVLTNVGPALAGAFTEGGAATDTLNVFGAAIGFAADHLGTFTKYLPLVITAFIAYKAITAGAIVLEAVRIPLLIAQIISNFALASAMRATTVATGTQTVAQWGLNTAMLANPIGLIIIAIVALVAGIWLLWNNSEGFRLFFIGMWDHIWGFLKAVGAWFAGPFAGFFVDAWNVIKFAGVAVWNWLLGIPEMLRNAFLTVGRFIAAPFVTAFNAVSRAWNSTVGKLSWQVPDWVPFLGGKTLSVKQLPEIALALGSGGVVMPQPGGVPALLAERGEAEVVAPLSKLPSLVGGQGGYAGKQEVTVRFEFAGADQEFVRMFRKIVKVYGNGNVQVMAT